MKIETDIPDEPDCLKCQHYQFGTKGTRIYDRCLIFRESITMAVPCEKCILSRKQAAIEIRNKLMD